MADRIGTDVTEDSIDAVAQELHEKLLLMGQTTKKVRVENIYEQSPQFEANVKVLMTAATLEEAKPQLEQVSSDFPSIPKPISSHLRYEHQSSQRPTETQSTAAATATAEASHHAVLPRHPHPQHTPLPRRFASPSMTMMPPTIQPMMTPRMTTACPRVVAQRHESP